MKFVQWAFPVIFFALTSQAFALCTPGTVVHCSVNGKPGTKECLENGRFTPCEPTDADGGDATGGATLTLKYRVLTVIYSPPGTKGGSSASEVRYAAESSTGTSTTSSDSFKQDYKLSAGVARGETFKAGASFEYVRSSEQSDALEIKKSSTSTIQMAGPPVDGVDHDRDEIWLWLGPKVRISVSGKEVSWAFDSAGTADIQYVKVGWLKNPSTMPPGVTQRLQQYAITPPDYPEILKANPLAACEEPTVQQQPTVMMRARMANRRPPLPVPCFTPKPGPPRFVSLNTTFPYEPPFTEEDPATTFTFTLDNSTMTTHTETTENDYTVGITAEYSFGLSGIWKASVKTEDSWTWTDKTTTAESTGGTQSISVTVGGPAFGYTGPTDIAVYFDRVYQTFAFAPIVAQPRVLRGIVLNSDGRPIAGQEVVTVARGIKHRTYTNAKGEYHFPSRFVGPIDIQVGTLGQRLPQTQPNQSIDFRFANERNNAR